MQIQDTIRQEMDDEATMLRVKNGEVKELDVLFRRHSKALFGFFYGMSRDSALSEDLVQEVFWRILRYRETYNGQLSFKSWTYRIARNLFIDRLRKQGKRTKVEVDSLEDHPDPEAKTGYQEAVRLDDRARLLEALDSLPEDQKEILVLSRFEGLSFKAVGEILNCSEGAAKVRAFRALQTLRATFLSKEGASSK
jgi:RNA polymerase sigma factor (sigma-70 family)